MQALRRLTLIGGWPEVQHFLPAAPRFSGLRRLKLDISAYGEHVFITRHVNADARLSCPTLRALPPALLSLELSQLVLRGPGLPPALEELCLCSKMGTLAEVDAELPSLRALTIVSVEDVRLFGRNLSLPRLTALELDRGCLEGSAAQVDFGRAPALAALTLKAMTAVAAPGSGPPTRLSRLQRLTRLAAAFLGNFFGREDLDPDEIFYDEDDEMRTVAEVLRLAPPCLRELDASGFDCQGEPLSPAMEATVGPPLAGITQLTALRLGDSLVLLPYLSGLHRLQELSITGYFLEDAHIPCLAALRSLRRLECTAAPHSLRHFECRRRASHCEASYCRRLEVRRAGCLAVA